MGVRAEAVEANAGSENWVGSGKAHHVGIGTAENRCGTKGAVGEDTCAGEESGVKCNARKPATTVAGFSL
jgi:hypothetical protein